MSVESFDENNLISEKKIFDERQKGLQIKIGREAMFIFAALALIYSISMDINRWTESISPAMLLILCICTLWYVIRCAIKGCMVAVSGRRTQIISFICITAGSVLQSIHWVTQIGKSDFLLKNGMLSDSFMFTAAFILLIICGTISLFAIYRENKMSKGDGTK